MLVGRFEPPGVLRVRKGVSVILLEPTDVLREREGSESVD